MVTGRQGEKKKGHGFEETEEGKKRCETRQTNRRKKKWRETRVPGSIRRRSIGNGPMRWVGGGITEVPRSTSASPRLIILTRAHAAGSILA